jgi:hypothetical protein
MQSHDYHHTRRSAMRGYTGYHSDNDYFNDQGIALPADQVAEQTEKFLK